MTQRYQHQNYLDRNENGNYHNDILFDNVIRDWLNTCSIPHGSTNTSLHSIPLSGKNHDIVLDNISKCT